jgi:hypothetical protein
MAVLATTHPTLIDVASRLDPGGKVESIVEILNLTNEVLDDAVVIEANGPTSHRTTVRSGLPQATWRKLNYGVQPGKSTTVQVTDAMGMLEAYGEIDKALADLNGNTAAFRMSEEMAYIEGLSQTMATTVFYGNDGIDEATFTGFSPRYSSLTAENADNIITTGNSAGANNTSIWLICWGPDTVHMTFPKGSQAGIQVEDLGRVTLESAPAGGGRMEAYRTHYRWDMGLVLRDWRYAVRWQFNPNVLTKNAASGADLISGMTDMIERLPNAAKGRAAFYMGRKPRAFLRQQLVNKVAASTLTMVDVAGRKVVAFDDIPVRRVDALLSTEAQLV